MERFSKKRQAILECLRSTDCHPTAAWVFEQLHPGDPNLSLGTVYRNLCQLKNAGMIRSMGVVAGEEHFDGCIDPHVHIMCRCCGKIMDLPHSPEMLQVSARIGAETGFADIMPCFIGECSGCVQAEAEKPTLIALS